MIVFFFHSRAIILKPGFNAPMDTSEQIVQAQKVKKIISEIKTEMETVLFLIQKQN